MPTRTAMYLWLSGRPRGTQQRLASIAGVPASTITRLKTGERPGVLSSTLVRVSGATFEVDPDNGLTAGQLVGTEPYGQNVAARTHS